MSKDDHVKEQASHQYRSQLNSSSEELPTRRTNASPSFSFTSHVTTSEMNRSFDAITLPFPLQFNEVYFHRIGLNFDEFFAYYSSKLKMSMTTDPIYLIHDFIDYCRRENSSFGLNEESLQHLLNIQLIENSGEPFDAYVFDYVTTQILKTLNCPNFDFESPPDHQWTQISYSSFDESTLADSEFKLNIYIDRQKLNRRPFGNKNVFDLLTSNKTEEEDSIRVYHGTDIESSKKICQYGIDLEISNRLGTDFGSGFYITETFDDALFVANLWSLRNKCLGAVLCFQLSRTEFNQFSIHDLVRETEQTNNPLEWSNFVKMCRRQRLQYPHRFRKDAIRGPICNNVEKVLHDAHERPQMKIMNGRKPMQICIKSTSMAAKVETSILGIYVISASSS